MGGASILGGIISGNAAKKGAQAQADASLQAMREQLEFNREALDLQQANYEQDRQFAIDQAAPYRRAGLNALSQLTDFGQGSVLDGSDAELYEAFRDTPGYQFAREEGLKAIQRANPGATMSSATAKDMGRFATGLADQTFSNYYNRKAGRETELYNRLAGLAGVGQAAGTSAVNTASALGQGFSNSLGQFAANSGNATQAGLTAAGAAQAGGMMGVSNAVNGTLNSLSGIAGAAQAGLFGDNPFSFRSSPTPRPFGVRTIGAGTGGLGTV